MTRIPLATYRVQLRREFDFDALRARLPYLAALGITDVYVSPILQAVPGSTHGYDVIDPTRISDDLGGEEGFRRLAEALREHDLGLIVDLVPNHMGVADGLNPWWEDVLRHGRGSRYARVFDIDWDVPDPALRGRVLLAILGDDLDAVLRRGEIGVEEHPEGPRLRYYDRALPLAPGTLETTGRSAAELHAARTTPEGIDVLRDLLDAQHYRLEFWREGKPRLNARRFFEIDTLIGVRQEDPVVFDLTHAKVLDLVRDRSVTGLRIDHIDGLADPAAYLERLRIATGGGEDGALPVYNVVEKILGRDEAMPDAWATHGTTGYDFLNDVNGLFIAHGQEGEIVRAYRRFTGREEQYLDIAYAARREVIEGALSGRFAVTIERLRAAAAPAFADIDARVFDEAVRALLASLPVYRTYHTAEALDPGAPSVMHAAMMAARAAAPDLDPVAVDAVRRLLSAPPTEALPAVVALQQLMPAVAAKGLEDCALYRYVPLASANAVGSAPDQSSESTPGFHAQRIEQHRRWPATMTTLATHDHKRGADMRARLDVLTEVADDWAAAVDEWHALNRSGATPAIHRHDEYTLYQTLVGCWPPGAGAEDLGGEFIERVRDYTIKAAREAGERTAWIDPDEAYEAALTGFVTRVLDSARSAMFLEQVAAFVARIAPAGAVNGLAMIALQVAAPGVPDTYQGRERWDFGLVDPDNRRPVDYATHEAFQAQLPPAGSHDVALPAHLLDAWTDGAVKQYVLARMLHARAAAPSLFLDGDYVPVEAQGERAAQVIAFARLHEDASAIVVVPRLSMSLTRPAEERWWTPQWGDTTLSLPSGCVGRRFRDVFTGEEVETDGDGVVRLADVLGRFPVALLL